MRCTFSILVSHIQCVHKYTQYLHRIYVYWTRCVHCTVLCTVLYRYTFLFTNLYFTIQYCTVSYSSSVKSQQMLEYQSAFSEFPNPNLNSGIVQVSMVNLIRKREEKHNPIYIAQIDVYIQVSMVQNYCIHWSHILIESQTLFPGNKCSFICENINKPAKTIICKIMLCLTKLPAIIPFKLILLML